MQTRELCSGSVLQERAAGASSLVCTGLKRLVGARAQGYSEKTECSFVEVEGTRFFRLLVRMLDHWAIRDSWGLGLRDTRKKSECSFVEVERTTFLSITSSDARPLSYKRLVGARAQGYSEKTECSFVEVEGTSATLQESNLETSDYWFGCSTDSFQLGHSTKPKVVISFRAVQLETHHFHNFSMAGQLAPKSTLMT